MLEVQKLLAETGSLQKLTESRGIRVLENPDDDRVILNYHMLDSPKTDPIVQECRSLTLNKTDYSLIARSFYRFFNLGENIGQTRKFRWDMPFHAEDKQDGSLVNLFFWEGQWRIQTRHSFAGAKISDSCPYTWEEVIWSALGKTDFNKLAHTVEDMSFSLELCSPYNRVVQEHHESKVVLLAAFNGYHEIEHNTRRNIGENLGIENPTRNQFNDVMDCEAYIAQMNRADLGFEGLVVQDCNGMRLKIKSDSYRALSRLWNNGEALRAKNLVPLIMTGKIHKLSEYYNSDRIWDRIEHVQNKIDTARSEIDDLWYCFKDSPSKKKFAKAVKHHPCAYVLFAAYDTGNEPDQYWDSDFVLKTVKGLDDV